MSYLFWVIGKMRFLELWKNMFQMCCLSYIQRSPPTTVNRTLINLSQDNAGHIVNFLKFNKSFIGNEKKNWTKTGNKSQKIIESFNVLKFRWPQNWYNIVRKQPFRTLKLLWIWPDLVNLTIFEISHIFQWKKSEVIKTSTLPYKKLTHKEQLDKNFIVYQHKPKEIYISFSIFGLNDFPQAWVALV